MGIKTVVDEKSSYSIDITTETSRMTMAFSYLRCRSCSAGAEEPILVSHGNVIIASGITTLPLNFVDPI